MEVAVVPRYETSLTEILNRSPIGNLPDALDTLRRGLRFSEEVWFGKVDGKIACVWGLVPPTIISDRAYLWLLTTDIVAEHKFLFIRKSQIYVADMLKRWPMLVGHVDVGNRSARRWLR